MRVLNLQELQAVSGGNSSPKVKTSGNVGKQLSGSKNSNGSKGSHGSMGSIKSNKSNNSKSSNCCCVFR